MLQKSGRYSAVYVTKDSGGLSFFCVAFLLQGFIQPAFLLPLPSSLFLFHWYFQCDRQVPVSFFPLFCGGFCVLRSCARYEGVFWSKGWLLLNTTVTQLFNLLLHSQILQRCFHPQSTDLDFRSGCSTIPQFDSNTCDTRWQVDNNTTSLE